MLKCFYLKTDSLFPFDCKVKQHNKLKYIITKNSLLQHKVTVTNVCRGVKVHIQSHICRDICLNILTHTVNTQ